MLPDSGLLFWMTIIFAIVFALLAKFGFPVITGMVEKRTKRIDDAIEAAREAEDRLRGLSAEQESLIAQARTEHDRILKEAAQERDRLVSEAQFQAQKEAEKIIGEAKVKIAEERDAALRDVRREIALISLSIAEKVVRKELSTDPGQKEFVDKMIEETADIS